MMILNVAVPYTFFSKKLRSNLTWLFIASVLVNIGIWFERFVIVVVSFSHNFLLSSWGLYALWITHPRPEKAAWLNVPFMAARDLALAAGMLIVSGGAAA